MHLYYLSMIQKQAIVRYAPLLLHCVRFIQKSTWTVITYHAHGLEAWRCRCKLFKIFFMDKQQTQDGDYEACWHIRLMRNLKPPVSDVVVDDNQVDDTLEMENEEPDSDNEDIPEERERSSFTRFEQYLAEIRASGDTRLHTRSQQTYGVQDEHFTITEDKNERWVHKVKDLLLWVVPKGRGNPNDYCWLTYSRTTSNVKCKCNCPNTPCTLYP